MTDYACNEFVAFYFNDPRTGEEALHRAVAQIEEHTPYRVCDLWLSPQRRVAVLNLVTGQTDPSAPFFARFKSNWLAALPRTNRLRLRGRMAILQTGYTTTPERRFERSIREQGGGLVCDDAGGIAAFCLVHFDGAQEERLFLWSTRPGVRAIASAEGPEGVVVGTRPRLVHALTRAFRAPDLDRSYLHASLNGWSFADHTPYEGTTLLAVDRLLSIRAGERRLQPHPTASYQREARIFRKQRVLFRDALRDASEPLRSLRGFELQLSGGKDSRLLAAVLSDRIIVPSTVICQGFEESPEVAVAKAVAKAVGWRMKQARPPFAYRGSLLDTVRYNLSFSDGFFATEPRHLAFPVGSFVGDVGPGFVMGHMELQKGGWTYEMSERRDAIVERCKRRMTRWRDAVAPELANTARAQVDAYVSSLPAMEDADYGYWINYQFRVGRWLTSHYLSHSKQNLPVYPLVDEKVTRVLSCAPLAHLVSERLLAETTWELAPMLRAVSLVGEPYRFVKQRNEQERQKRARAVAHENGGARTATVSSAPPAPITDASVAAEPVALPCPGPAPTVPEPVPAPSFINEPLAREACAHIAAGRLREELRTLIQPHVWDAFVDPTHARMVATGMGATPFTSLLWTCYQASVLFTDGPSTW